MIVFVALLPIVVVSFIQGFATLQNTRNIAESRLRANAQVIAERQRDPFVIAQHLLMTVAASPEVREMSEGCDRPLAAGLRDYKPIVNFVRSDANGFVRCSVIPFEQGATLAQQPWWQKGIKSPGMTITPPVIGTVSKRKLLILMLPIRAADGAQDGALSVGIDSDYMAKAISKTLEAQSGVVAIISADGRLVIEGTKAFPFKPKITGELEGTHIGRSEDGELWTYALATLYGSDLKIIYAEPRQELLEPGVQQIRASILLPIISILFASLAIAFGTHWLVVRWLQDLGRVANRFAKGDFSGDRLKFDDAPREIAALSTDLHEMAEVIDKRSKELESALDAKTELTREVHHRVKNNLQIITSLLTLQAGRVHEPRAGEVLGQTRARISALALIHRLLYEQDAGNERGEVAIDSLMQELCGQLRSANRNRPNVDLKCEASPIPVAIDHAVPLALFIVEAVTNAYRHAFAPDDQGRINLKFKQHGLDAVLEVQDNGQGFSSNNDHGQMGTELMNAFALQVGGELQSESEIGQGTHVTLKMPMAA